MFHVLACALTMADLSDLSALAKEKVDRKTEIKMRLIKWEAIMTGV